MCYVALAHIFVWLASCSLSFACCDALRFSKRACRSIEGLSNHKNCDNAQFSEQ